MMEWHPEQGFPTTKQMARMVAAEVRAQVEAGMQREREKAEKAESRRDRLRGVYRRHIGKGGKAVDFGKVRNLVEGDRRGDLRRVARPRGARPYRACGGYCGGYYARGLRRSRVPREPRMCELNGVKNVVTLARRLA